MIGGLLESRIFCALAGVMLFYISIRHDFGFGTIQNLLCRLVALVFSGIYFTFAFSLNVLYLIEVESADAHARIRAEFL